MSISPIITFKAGQCTLDTSVTPPRVKPQPTPGYIYLYSEDDLIQFCWRPRSAPLESPELELTMVPTDGTFTPYEATSSDNPSNPKKPTNGRIYVLKFSSSSKRYLFYLQSRSQHPSADPAWFSARDLKLGQIVNTLLQGEEIDVQQAIASLPADQNGNDGDEDETMEDVEGQSHEPDHRRGGSGGAGPGATGGDIREEGQEAREGGADGGRAPDSNSMDASSIIQNFIQSMGGAKGESSTSAPQQKIFTTLPDLLTPTSTISLIEQANEESINSLLQYLPPTLVKLALEKDAAASMSFAGDSTTVSASTATLEQKKEVLRKVLHSPQFYQSLASLTFALRDGGLPSISEALNIPVRNGGYMRRGAVPLGGGDAVETFLEGVKDLVKKGAEKSEEQMDTD